MVMNLIKKWHNSGLGRWCDKRGGLLAHGAIDYLLFYLLLIISALGLIMLYSASYPRAYADGNSYNSIFMEQLTTGFLIGALAFLVLSKINYKVWMEIGAFGGTLASVAFLVAVLVPGLVKSEEDGEGGSIQRWLDLGLFSFQPSDVAKLTLILMLAYILHKYHEDMVSKKALDNRIANFINTRAGKVLITRSWKVVLICGGIIVLYVGLVFAGSHLSGAVILLAISAVMLYLGEISKKWIGACVVAAVIGVVVLYFAGALKDYMEDRITQFISGESNLLTGGYQSNQALYAIGSGGLLGKGIGNSLQKFWVPEAQNDMIFSIVVEELGLIGAMGVIVIFCLIIWRGILIGINCPSRYGSLVACGITFKLAIHVILNICVATSLIPNTGISLPFFSSGNTALIMTLAEMGILMSISRTSHIRKKL